MSLKTYYHPTSGTYTYLYWTSDKSALIIDSVADFDSEKKKVSYESIDTIVDFMRSEGLNLKYIFETHVHADHFSAAQYLKEIFPDSLITISSSVTQTQKIFADKFPDVSKKGSEFDLLMKDGETIESGQIAVMPIFCPGHTPTCTSLLIDDMVFTGDALFMPDFGTGRCDFPGGSSQALYLSITKKLFALPENTKVYVGHDYGRDNRGPHNVTSIGESKKNNIHINEAVSLDEFVSMRSERDQTLDDPRLLLPSLEVNLKGGVIPPQYL